MKTIDWAPLEQAAREAAARAYCPYSRFRVGAALLAADGRLFTGVNIENGAYGLTVCAERVALWSAVAGGGTAFAALALAAGDKRPATPCGACRQVLAEFCPPSLPIRCVTLAAAEDGRPLDFTLAELLPHAFALTGRQEPSPPPRRTG